MKTFVVLSTLFVFKATGNSETLLFRPKGKCVPTATIQGPRHECVCFIDGIYHCRPLTDGNVEDDSDTPASPIPACEPNQLYRQGSNLCSCTSSGSWRSASCREQFHRLLLKTNSIRKNIRTDITCEPGGLYITDCNVCICQDSGIINFESCTTRSCPKRRKSDSCLQGDVFRTNNEFCFCSTVNFYVDNFCVKVGEGVMEEVEEKSLADVFDVANVYASIDLDECDSNVTLYIDCNTCTCYKNTYLCTSRLCYDEQAVLRSGHFKEKLPELKSKRHKCTPGLKYKYKCNTCVCNRSGNAICTSMICLQDIVMDAPMLRKAIVSY